MTTLELLAVYTLVVAAVLATWLVAVAVRAIAIRMREHDDPRIDASSVDWRRAREHRRRYEASERERASWR